MRRCLTTQHVGWFDHKKSLCSEQKRNRHDDRGFPIACWKAYDAGLIVDREMGNDRMECAKLSRPKASVRRSQRPQPQCSAMFQKEVGHSPAYCALGSRLVGSALCAASLSMPETSLGVAAANLNPRGESQGGRW